MLYIVSVHGDIGMETANITISDKTIEVPKEMVLHNPNTKIPHHQKHNKKHQRIKVWFEWVNSY